MKRFRNPPVVSHLSFQWSRRVGEPRSLSAHWTRHPHCSTQIYWAYSLRHGTDIPSLEEMKNFQLQLVPRTPLGQSNHFLRRLTILRNIGQIRKRYIIRIGKRIYFSQNLGENRSISLNRTPSFADTRYLQNHSHPPRRVNIKMRPNLLKFYMLYPVATLFLHQRRHLRLRWLFRRH